MLTKFFLKNQITLLFVLFIVLIGGIVSLLKLGKLETPILQSKQQLLLQFIQELLPMKLSRKSLEKSRKPARVQVWLKKSGQNQGQICPWFMLIFMKV
jgi:uncharacterized membrane protein YraQ (UPF0718 family)